MLIKGHHWAIFYKPPFSHNLTGGFNNSLNKRRQRSNCKLKRSIISAIECGWLCVTEKIRKTRAAVWSRIPHALSLDHPNQLLSLSQSLPYLLPTEFFLAISSTFSSFDRKRSLVDSASPHYLLIAYASEELLKLSSGLCKNSSL